MKTLEEKRKKIEALCQNINNNEIKVALTINLFTNEHFITVHSADSGLVPYNFHINDNYEYNNLIKYLKKNQKQPELYTWQEIDRVGKKWIEERHSIKEHTSVFDFLKLHMKPYKK